ncbi:MAG: BrnT family toxin [Thermoanaerobaculia bacterium]
MSFVFEWHFAKAASNLSKHGIGFEEAATVFADPLARIFDDPDHSQAEAREVIVGHSAAERLLVVSFAARRDSIRIINARQATKRERRDYEENVTP